MVDQTPPQGAPLQGDGVQGLAETAGFIVGCMTAKACIGLEQSLTARMPFTVAGLEAAAPTPSLPTPGIAAPAAGMSMLMAGPKLLMGLM